MTLRLLTLASCVALFGCYTQVETKGQAQNEGKRDTTVLSDAGHVGIDSTLMDSTKGIGNDAAKVDGPVTGPKSESRAATNVDSLKAATFSKADSNAVIVWDCFPYLKNGGVLGKPFVAR